MFKLSIIVPAAGPQEHLDETLLGVLENRPPNCEVVVPHGPGYIDPYDLEDEVRFVAANSISLPSLINQGVVCSHAPIVHIVHRVRASANWTDAPVERLTANPQLASVSPLIISQERNSRIVAAGVCCRRSGKRQLVGAGQRCRGNMAFEVDGPTLHAAFWNRHHLMELGGYRDCFGLDRMDADLAVRMQVAGLSCETDSSSRLIGEPQEVQTGYQAAREAEQFYRTLVESDYPTSGLLHVAHVTSELLRQLPSPRSLTSFAGYVRGWLAGAIEDTPAALADAFASESHNVISLTFDTKKLTTSHRTDTDGRHYAKSA